MGNSSKEETATGGDTSSGDIPPSNSNIFCEGERVLAYHGPRIYEAKAYKHLAKKQGVYKSSKSGRSSQSKPKSSAVKFPELLAYVNIEEKSLIRLQQKDKKVGIITVTTQQDI
ncbi:hypothetical protein GQ457_04G035100 [Hibiscus cannabinus]